MDWRPVKGHVHSVEAGGTVDGPGVRFVVFTAGCPLSCLYCHNPDCRTARHDQLTTAGAMVDEIATYAPFLRRAGGGVTVSGGEPLLQPRFTAALLAGSKSLGLHTALDTSGYGAKAAPAELLEATDLVLLDIKSWDHETYRRVTGVELEPTLELALRLAALDKPVWLRFVLVPGVTDAPANVEGLAAFVATLPNVQRVDVLPFHKMGEYKWAALGLPYTLADVQPPTPETIARVHSTFRQHGLRVA